MERNTKLNLTLQVHQSQENLVGPMGHPMDRPGRRDLGNGLSAEGQPFRSKPEDEDTDLFLMRLDLVLILRSFFVALIPPRFG